MSALGGDLKIDLAWTEPASQSDSIEIRSRLTGIGSYVKLARVDSGVVSYSHTGLASNISRQYILYNIKGTVSSAPSSIVSATTNDTTNTETEESGFLVIINAETGDLSQWSAAGDTVLVGTSYALHGNYGFRAGARVAVQDDDYGRINFTLTDSVRARFYFTGDGTMTQSSYYGTDIFAFYKGSTKVTNTSINYRETNVSALNRDNTDDITPAGWDVTDTTYIEVYYKKGTGADGIVKVWADGVLKVDSTSIPDTVQIDNARFGFVANGNRISLGGWIKFDDCIVNIDTAIGSYNGEGGTTGGAIIPTRWFVEKGATGTGTYRTIENAGTTFANIPWSSMATGDTLFISGGADSLTYYETLNISKNGIIVVRMNETGHNGTVIIDGQSMTRDYGIYIDYEGSITVDGVDASKFKIKSCGANIYTKYSSGNITFKNINTYMDSTNANAGLSVYTIGVWDGTPAPYTPNITFDNINVYQTAGYYEGGGNSDGIHVHWIDGLTVKNCTVVLQNGDSYPHADCLQLYNNTNMTIENNKIYNLKVGVDNDATDSKMGIFLQDAGGVIKIRNNYVYQDANAYGTCLGYDNRYASHPLDSIIVTNNTVVSTGVNSQALGVFYSYTGLNVKGRGIVQNNIISYTGTGSYIMLDTMLFNAGQVDYNIVYHGGTTPTIYTGRDPSYWTTWAAWQSYGYDVNSFTTNPVLTGYIPNVSGDADDNGTDPSVFGYTNDILGTVRTTPFWIGCYEP